MFYPRNTEYEIFRVGKKAHTLGALFILNHKTIFEEGLPPVRPIVKKAREEGALLELDKHNWPWSMMLAPVFNVDLYELANNHMWETEFAYRDFGAPPPDYMKIPREGQAYDESGWISYTASRSERTDHPGAATRLFDYDQTHVLAIVANWAWRGLNLGTRFRYTSGFPRTPVAGSFFDSRDDQFQPLFGAQNSIRIPAFYQLDARLEKSFTLRRYKLNAFVDVQNVTNRKNAEEIIYNFDFTRRAYISGLPTLAVLGLRLEF